LAEDATPEGEPIWTAPNQTRNVEAAIRDAEEKQQASPPDPETD